MRKHRNPVELTLPSGPPKLPKLTLLLCPCRVDGGLPPLADGCGIGEGEAAGEVARGFVGWLTDNELEAWLGCGDALAAAGVPSAFIEPNRIPLPVEDFPATEPPFGKCPEALTALTLTAGLRLCSPGPEVELVGVLPLTIVGEPTVGTAGGIAILPFTGDFASLGATIDAVDELEAGGGENGFFVALA